MSNLSKRVEKAKKLQWSHSLRNPSHYSTWGSNGNGEQYYHIDLDHKEEIIVTPDGKRAIITLLTDCKVDTGNGRLSGCPGNEHNHTVCYHGMGALYESFKKSDKLISFFDTYQSACQMAFNGKIVKVQAVQGNGFVWAVIKDWPKSKIRNQELQDNINLMRGPENEQDGID